MNRNMFANKTLVIIIAVCIISATITGVAYALLTIGTGTSSFPINRGSSLQVTGATITNGTQSGSCSLVGSTFTCSLGEVKQGGNATIKVTVQNSGQVSGVVWTSTACQAKNITGTFNCSSDGVLTDAGKTTINAQSSAMLVIFFAVSANADTNDTITLTTTVIQS